MPKRSVNPAQASDIRRLYDIYQYMMENKHNPDIGWDEVMKIFKSIPMKNMRGKIREMHADMLVFLEFLRAQQQKEPESCILDRQARESKI